MLRYYITDRHRAGGIPSLLRHVERAAAGNVDFIQLREKDLPASELLALTQEVLELVRPYGTRILVNSRTDVALAAGAHGVHLPAGSLPPQFLRAISPPGFLIGVSTHLLAEAHAAQSEGADFVVFGPVFRTLSKIHSSDPVGVPGLAQVVKHLTIPVLALGGITHANAEQCIAAGAAGIAAISLFQT